MGSEHQLSDLQLAIMKVVWLRGEAAAAEVHQALCDEGRDLAPTTVATVMSRLEKRGLLTHRTEGRQYIYASKVEEQEIRRSMLERVTHFFFGGDTSALVHHLVGARDVGQDDLEAIKRLIARKEGESEDGNDG